MYNYKHFRASEYRFEEFIGPKAGEKAKNFEATTLDGKKVKLSDFFSKKIVLEIGSITCPIYQSKKPKMNKLAKKYNNFWFLLLYTREAHPGYKIPSHKSFKEKFLRAKQLEKDNENRLILIDDLDGTAHKAYGSMPNSLYVIDTTSKILFRSDWNDVIATQDLLEKLEKGQDISGVKKRLRAGSIYEFFRTMHLAGLNAMIDYILAIPGLIHDSLKLGLKLLKRKHK